MKRDPRDSRIAELLASGSNDAATAEAVDADLIWKAAAGELSADQTGQLLDLASKSPNVAEAWRLAVALQGVDGDAATGFRVRSKQRRIQSAIPLAMAAVLTLGIGLWVIFRTDPQSELPAYRSVESSTLASEIADGISVSRESLELVWTPADGDGWRYQLRVTGEDLREIVLVNDLLNTTFAIDPGLLDNVKSGSRIYWRVEAENTDGRRLESQTFFVRVK